MKLIEFATRKNLLALLLAIGLVQVAGYYLAGMLASGTESMAVAQPDTLLYCQAARRIVEGHPFSFSKGASVCTGTTTVLYPFLLALPYALGATGESLLTAGFALNALFYLVFLAGWGVALFAWLERPLARLTAALLLALACQPAYCALAQSDIGCWLAVSGLLAAGLATDRKSLYGPVLLLAPWFRPEGMVCVLAFAGVTALRLAWDFRRAAKFRWRDHLPDVVWSLAGLLSLVGVFALNHALTGAAQFSSVSGKGYFKQLPFSLAVNASALDLLDILKGCVLGFPTAFPRGYFHFPFLSGLLLLTALFAYPWKRPSNRHLPILILAACGGILTVAHSGWQNTNFDRYLVWISPLVTLFVADGCRMFAKRVSKGVNRALPTALLVLFALGAAVTSVFVFHATSATCDRTRQFAVECEAALPPKASVGVLGGCGFAYCLSPRRLAQLSGIYSPEFTTRLLHPGSLAILKNEPATRFDYWLETGDKLEAFYGNRAAAERCAPPQRLGPDGLQLARADWTPLDAARTPALPPPQGLALVDRVDVAYEKDETRTAYEVIDRYGRPALPPFVHYAPLGAIPVLDCGRILVGGDAMTVNLRTNTPATVVLRTLPRQTAESFGLSRRTDVYSFANPLSLRVTVDGADAGLVSLPYSTNGFSDVSFQIPAAALTQSPARVAFLGDHIACGYWFYQ